MFEASSYIYIYILFIAFLTFYECLRMLSAGTLIIGRTNSSISLKAILLLVIVVVFIGFRPESGAFVDMMNYVNYYNFLEGEHFVFNINAENKLFDNLFLFFASNSLGYTSFFFIIALFYFLFIFLSSRKLFGKYVYIGFLTYLGAFSTFSYATNGIKAGVAASLFLVALAYKENKKISWFFILLSVGFHHSMLVCAIAFFVTSIIKRNIYFYYLIWFLCLLIAVLGIDYFQVLFSQFSDERVGDYLISNNDWGGKTGFRYDFVLYSAVPILLGLYFIRRNKILSTDYSFLLSFYMLSNSVWLLCMNANFTNRIAYLSWFFYPFILIYPFFSEVNVVHRLRSLIKVVIGHICFTLFMFLIYYN